MYYNNPYLRQQMPTYPQAYQQVLNGRVVSNIEEARAAQIPIDGTACYFPCPAAGKIFVKSIDLNGMAVFQVFELAQSPAQPVYAESSAVQALERRISELENKLKGAMGNVQSANDTANNATDAVSA